VGRLLAEPVPGEGIDRGSEGNGAGDEAAGSLGNMGRRYRPGSLCRLIRIDQ
jgi:hypothetical protein